MTELSVDALTDELRTLLIKERDLLQAGYPAESISLVEKKTELMNQLGPALDAWEQGDVPFDKIERIREISVLAAENAVRFDAVRHGLRSLIDRLSKHGAGTTIGAYDPSGKPLEFQRSTGSYKVSV